MAISDTTTGIAWDLRELAESFKAAWNGHDPHAMAQLVTDDIVWADPALHEPAVGIPAVQEFMRASYRAFPDLRFGESDPPVLTAGRDVALWGWHMKGTQRGPIKPPGFAPTDRPMRVEGIDRWTMRDGRIARCRAFYDFNELARQLAIVPTPGSRAERGLVAFQRFQARLERR
jgi:steroid delta-isomerase-like uncharacterized protein